MVENMYRYYKQQTITLECEVVTPMFLGNASGEAEWRAEAFKSLVRYWWRVAQKGCSDQKALFKKEGELFGMTGDEKSNCKSSLSLFVYSEAKANNQRISNRNMPMVRHEECENRKDPKKDKKVDPLLYLAGMGLLKPDNSIKPGRSYFSPGEPFILSLNCPGNEEGKQEIFKSLALINAFGAIGGRCRNGWGSFRIKNPKEIPCDTEGLLKEVTIPWKKGLCCDFPNSLGKDEGEKPLLWKTAPADAWEDAMAKLAKAYIDVRAHKIAESAPLNPGSGKNDQVQERHLLGIPLTHHGYGKQDNRHASPLRFIVKKQHTKFTGYILHIPHGHSKKQSLAQGVDQEKVWEKVHKKLDNIKDIIERAEYREVIA